MQRAKRKVTEKQPEGQVRPHHRYSRLWETVNLRRFKWPGKICILKKCLCVENGLERDQMDAKAIAMA